MLSRERVIEVIKHRKPDRIPLYGWVGWNLPEKINARWGSLEAFESKYEFDYAHLFGGPGTWSGEHLQKLGAELKRPIEPADLRDVPTLDPNDMAAYEGVKQGIAHHRDKYGRFTYIQTPGLFEALNGIFGIENHLAYLALYPDDIKDVYARQAAWNKAFALNCLDLGVDMIHVSDDWGSERSLLFSPRTWRELIYPYHKITCDAVKARGGFMSLHCDGNFTEVIDGVIELGYDVVHPWQESAGMSLKMFKDKYASRLTVMGGLDVQTTIGFGKLDFLVSEIDRVMRMFADGGLLFCTTHFVQNHCTVEELELAFDTAYALAREVTK
ncbi:MAG: uroporphyrinogen decarboxylase family protein [Planctomycetaceae bacterium]